MFHGKKHNWTHNDEKLSIFQAAVTSYKNLFSLNFKA